jgi:ABC-type ATPase involved in cell division
MKNMRASRSAVQPSARETGRAPAQEASPEKPPAVRLHGLTKTYRGSRIPAVDSLSLDIHDGEIVTLLGPSGCGKSTTLRIVAGLEQADAGSIHFGDRAVLISARGISLSPEKRRVGMVFQSYAIWPHMTVGQNVAFPLRALKYPRTEISDRVERALDLVGMSGFQDRQAPLLSGGQQQRVSRSAIWTRSCASRCALRLSCFKVDSTSLRCLSPTTSQRPWAYLIESSSCGPAWCSRKAQDGSSTNILRMSSSVTSSARHCFLAGRSKPRTPQSE